MKLRKVVKRIVALGTGATMLLGTLGATMAAADLANYPAPFIKDGAFSGMLVIGDKAAAEDVVGVSDIAVSLQFAATKTSSTTSGTETTVSGDVFKIEASGDNLNIMQPLSGVKDVIDKSDMDALADGSLANDKGTYTYNQFLTLGNSTVQFVVSDESGVTEDPHLYLRVKSDGDTNNIEDGSETFRYKLSFPTSAKSDIDSSKDLDDFDNKKLTILGKEYSITNTEFSNAGKLTLEMMGGAVQDTMQEGETKTYTINGVDYEVTVTTITDATPYKVKFLINGETTDSLQNTETYTLSDKSLIGVKELLPNEAGDVTADVVEFYLGANKLKLQDSNSSTANADGTLTVGSNDITDGSADLVWSNTSTELSLSTIQIAWQSGDDYYIPIGGKLSEHVTGDQDVVDLVSALNIDFEFAGMSQPETDFIKMAPSGSTNVKLTYTNKNGDKTSEELWWYDGSGSIYLAKDGNRNVSVVEDGGGGDATVKNLVAAGSLHNTSYVYDEDFFVVETNKYSHLMQVKKFSSTDKTITLKDVGTGQTETVSVDSSNDIAKFYKDGYEYQLTTETYENATLSKIAGDSTDLGLTTDADVMADLWTQYGAKIKLLRNGTFIIEEPSNGHEDNPTVFDADEINITITISSSKLTPSGVASSSLEYDGSTISSTIALDSDDNKQEAYTTWGTFISQDTSGDQDTVEITYPEKELIANVYITSGVTTQVAGSTESESVTIQRIEVGATKLASEVADITAQNAIIVGGPCANAAAATILGNPADCAEGFTAGSGKIELYEDATAGTVAMLVAGYTAADTRAATGVVSNYGDYALTGTKMEVTTATSTVKEVTETAAE